MHRSARNMWLLGSPARHAGPDRLLTTTPGPHAAKVKLEFSTEISVGGPCFEGDRGKSTSRDRRGKKNRVESGRPVGRGLSPADWTSTPSGLPDGEVTLRVDQRQFSLEPRSGTCLANGGTQWLLRQFSAARADWGESSVCSAGLPRGAYEVLVLVDRASVPVMSLRYSYS
jgi:hypothetical protein